jgi:hypothetical protein
VNNGVYSTAGYCTGHVVHHRIVLHVEQEYLGWKATVHAKLHHCPIVPLSNSLVVGMCSIKMHVAGALVSAFGLAMEDCPMSFQNYLVKPVGSHPPKNNQVNLHEFIGSIPFELTLGIHVV